MPANKKFVDRSIHNITGNVITGHAQVGSVTTIVHQSKNSIDWEKMLCEYHAAIERMNQEQYKIFAAGFASLEQALKQKDEAKSKQCASRLGEYGISVLKDCSADILSGFLMKLIGL